MKVPICEVDIYIVAGSDSEVKKLDKKNPEHMMALEKEERWVNILFK